MENNINIHSYDKFNEINLIDIRYFFNKKIFKRLIECYNIYTLGELFTKAESGELKKIISDLSINQEQKTQHYKEISGIICTLKCNYLKEDPLMKGSDTLEELRYKLDLSDFDITKLKVSGITTLGQLLEIIKNNNAYTLTSSLGLGQITGNRLIKKLKIVYEYYNKNEDKFTISNSSSDEKTRNLKDIPLEEVKPYFSTSVFNSLKNVCGILTLGDLFEKVENREFYDLISKVRIRKCLRNELINVVIGTVNVLKCKYLNCHPQVNKDTELRELHAKLGLYDADYKILETLRFVNLSKLFKMLENNSFKFLTGPKYKKNRIEVLVNKIRVIYNFYNPEKIEKVVEVAESKETLTTNAADYENLKSISLNEVRIFFHYALFNALTNAYKINTLGDLFTKEANGTLKNIVYKSGYNQEEHYNVLSAIIKILKCKYLNEDPMIDENTPVQEFSEKLGLLYYERGRLEYYGIKNLSQLLQMASQNDFSSLSEIPYWGATKVASLSAKIKVIYNYYHPTKEVSESKNICEISSDEIHILYNELKRLIAESNRLSEEISKVQAIIDEKTNDKNQDNNLAFNNDIDYSRISNISIIEVRNFFSASNFDFLVYNGFLTLGDLFDVNFHRLLMNFEERPYNERLKIIATIKILRCKYLGEDPKINGDLSYRVFETKLGISFRTQLFLHNELGINKLDELLQMIENKDFAQLNQIGYDDLIPKLVVLHNFNKSKSTFIQAETKENTKLSLYKNLKELIIRSKQVNAQLNEAQSNLYVGLQKIKRI